MQTVNHGPSGFFGAVVAWLCIAPVVFAREALSTLDTLVPASSPVPFIGNLSAFLIWITGGIFLVVGGILAFAPFKVRAHKSDSVSTTVQIYRPIEIDLAWTVIPVLVVLALAVAP